MSIDCYGTCDIWTRKQQRARKDHKCDCCGEPIERGHLAKMAPVAKEQADG